MHLRELLDRLEQPPDTLRLASGKNISMPGELWGRLDAVAEAMGCSRSALIRLIVESSLDELERDLAELANEEEDYEEQTGQVHPRREARSRSQEGV